MKIKVALALLATLSTYAARADTFGNSENTFEIEFAQIGAPDNPGDTPSGLGKVQYSYRMGKYEISEDMIDKASALGGPRLTHDYRGANRPATSLTWFEVAKFVNWLNTSTGHTPAYKFDDDGVFLLWQSTDDGYDPNNIYRNTQARYFLPSDDEWYKAAYYDSGAGVYYDYASGSNYAPDGIDSSGDTVFDAVVRDPHLQYGPNSVFDVGVPSPNGTFGQAGNVWEVLESSANSSAANVLSSRLMRGGSWTGFANHSHASSRAAIDSRVALSIVGFRVASRIPEPTTLTLAGLGIVAAVWSRRRRR